jgi:hypothetical protein
MDTEPQSANYAAPPPRAAKKGPFFGSSEPPLLHSFSALCNFGGPRGTRFCGAAGAGFLYQISPLADLEILPR